MVYVCRHLGRVQLTSFTATKYCHCCVNEQRGRQRTHTEEKMTLKKSSLNHNKVIKTPPKQGTNPE